jgi:hypothetical protein
LPGFGVAALLGFVSVWSFLVDELLEHMRHGCGNYCAEQQMRVEPDIPPGGGVAVEYRARIATLKVDGLIDVCPTSSEPR